MCHKQSVRAARQLFRRVQSIGTVGVVNMDGSLPKNGKVSLDFQVAEGRAQRLFHHHLGITDIHDAVHTMIVLSLDAIFILAKVNPFLRYTIDHWPRLTIDSHHSIIRLHLEDQELLGDFGLSVRIDFHGAFYDNLISE